MLQPSTQKIEVKNYPYGRLKTSMFFWVEFKSNKGFRAVTQTINPKNGRLNKPHAGTYSDIILLDYTDGFAKFIHRSFYEVEKLPELSQWITDNWSLFTTEQHSYLYRKLFNFMRIEASAICTYCGSKPDEVLPILDSTIKLAVKGLKSPDVCLFNEIDLDVDKLNSTKVEGYNPFKVTSYGV